MNLSIKKFLASYGFLVPDKVEVHELLFWRRNIDSIRPADKWNRSCLEIPSATRTDPSAQAPKKAAAWSVQLWPEKTGFRQFGSRPFTRWCRFGERETVGQSEITWSYQVYRFATE